MNIQNREICLISCSPCRDILELVGMRNYLIIGKLNVIAIFENSTIFINFEALPKHQ